ncbi:MAG: hypothetical protein LQ344_007828 [Seirophora lacunosa]|nr:MAG: hypothetical protein LQ344_007828 [Seirophora lacunosa]
MFQDPSQETFQARIVPPPPCRTGEISTPYISGRPKLPNFPFSTNRKREKMHVSLLRFIPPLLLLAPLLILAAQPPSRTNNRFRRPTTNLTAEPRIECDRNPASRLSKEQIRECKSAVAHLPPPYRESHLFGPDQAEHIYRTPFSSTHATRCEARVQLLGQEILREERSSWAEIKYAAWDVLAECMDTWGSGGVAVVGMAGRLEVGVMYHWER